MYLYFDRKGVLKEIINDEALRQGNYGVNYIKIFWEGTAEQGGNGTSYISLEASYLREDGSSVGPLLCDTFVTEQIPFDRKRDLRWFKYYKDYRFCVIDLSRVDEDDQSALDVAGTVHCSLIAHLAPGDLYQFGQVNFEVAGDPRAMASTEYISLSDYKYLKKIVFGSHIEVGDVTASAESLPEGSDPTASMQVSGGYDAAANLTVMDISLDLGIPTGATGAQGPQGPQGPQGERGNDGTSVVIRESAAACVEVGNGYIDANGHLQVLTSLDPRTFVDAGQIQGPAGSVAIGTVTTGAPGSQAGVTNSGTGSNAILNFTIPRGQDGTNGQDGDYVSYYLGDLDSINPQAIKNSASSYFGSFGLGQPFGQTCYAVDSYTQDWEWFLAGSEDTLTYISNGKIVVAQKRMGNWKSTACVPDSKRAFGSFVLTTGLYVIEYTPSGSTVVCTTTISISDTSKIIRSALGTTNTGSEWLVVYEDGVFKIYDNGTLVSSPSATYRKVAGYLDY